MTESDITRPDPDRLLEKIRSEETPSQKKGYLKIFLGYCAGVGKTYRMLSEGQALHRQHQNVVIGIVETHGRKETIALTKGLEEIPRTSQDYRGITLTEFDIDKALELKPQILLLDELAHTNNPGSRHPKRYQDVEELLEQGISVYTTLNIQHIESVQDIVQQITGIGVQETVPDRILERADKIELVDLPPEELLQRLSEGKVYVPEKARTAVEKFFRKGNLLALRELALRYTARRVDEAMMSYMYLQGIRGPWGVGSKLLVCVSPSPLSEHPIRVTQRLAEDLKAEWFAVYVETPRQGTLQESRRLQLDKNLQMAEDSGAKIIRLNGLNPADEILEFARTQNITLIISGFSGQSRWQRLLKGSLVNELIEKSSPIQVLVVGSQKAKYPSVRPLRKALDKSKILQEIMVPAGSIAIMTAFCWLVQPWLNITNIALLYLLPIVFSSLVRGRLGGIVASVLAVMCFNFFFIHPVFTFSVSDFQFLPTFLVLFIVGLTTSLLSDIIQKQTEAARKRERFISLLYEFSRDLMHAIGLVELLDRSTEDLSALFNCESYILLPDSNGKLTIYSQSGDELLMDEREIGIAAWSMSHNKPAGRGTDTLTSSPFRFIPLIGEKETLGVLAIGRPQDKTFFSLEEEYQLESFVGLISLALEHAIARRRQAASSVI